MTKFTEEHEWVRTEGEEATIGITNHAQEQLGELVYVELPEVGASFAKGDTTGVVESTKTASDIYAPVDCQITEINKALEDQPDLVNSSPEEDGWLYKIRLSSPEQLNDLLDQEDL